MPIYWEHSVGGIQAEDFDMDKGLTVKYINHRYKIQKMKNK